MPQLCFDPIFTGIFERKERKELARYRKEKDVGRHKRFKSFCKMKNNQKKNSQHLNRKNAT
jgi:hypothetical protein